MPARSLDAHEPVIPRLMPDASEPVPYLLHAPDQFALAVVLRRLASLARWLSDAELQDLACMLARDTGPQGRSRVAIVAAGQEQLGALAAEAVSLLPDLRGDLLAVRPGIFAAEDGDGRVTLLLSDAHPEPGATGPLTGTVDGCLHALRWLEAMDVHAAGAVGHGMGALAGLAWAGVLGQDDVIEIADLRAKFQHRSGAAPTPAVAAETSAETSAETEAAASPRPPRRVDAIALRAAIGQKYRFGPPRRRLISTFTGAEIGSVDDAIDLICSGFAGAEHVADAIAVGSVGATLLLETGPGSTLADVASARSSVPAVGLPAGTGDPGGTARVAAALFAAGALRQPQALFAGRPGRPIDIWRERTFIVGPCETRPEEPVRATPRPGTAVVPAAAQDAAAGDGAADQIAPVAAAAQPAEEVPAASVAPEAEAAAPEAADVSAPDPRPEPAVVLAAPDAGPVDSKAVDPGTGDPSTGDPGTGGDSDEGRADRARLRRLADLRAALARQQAAQIIGAGRWARCYAEIVRPAEHPAARGKPVPWRLHVSGNRTRFAAARSIFRADPAAPRTLAIISDPADHDGRAVAVQAAREAIETGSLVVVTTSPDFTGFFAGLHAEHPETAVTVLRVPDDNAIKLAAKYAHVVPGQFRELILAPDGSAGEPAMSELALTGGDPFPLGPEDVVLVSRGARGAGLALAQVLACCGTAVAVIGGAEDDTELLAGLEELRLAGARVGYEAADLASPTSLAAAVQRVEAELGPVTAIGHAVSPSDPAPLLDLTDIELSDHAANEVAMLDLLVGTVRTGQLRMIITFGSVAGRYGMAGAGVAALSSAALAARAAELAAAGNGRNLHIDIPGWSAPGFGGRPGLTDYFAAAGNAPLDVSTASRLLLKIMTTQELPERVALHGRVSGPAARITSVPAVAEVTAAQLAAAGLGAGGRFLTNVLVHYPGIELVCAPALALDTDPYLADYQLDGLPMLPPALAIEALAQAASVLAGRPLRSAARVRLESPIVVPAGGRAELRVCAVREGARITTVLRCGDSSFAVDHARAEFACADRDELSPAVIPPVTAHAALAQLAGQTGLVDGAELYGSTSFQDGRFRRIALLPEVTTRSCRALARGADDQLWFAPGSAYADTQFLLGSPGLTDATLQVLQASMPHRRLRTAGCAAARFSGRAAEGAVEIWASAVPDGGTVPAQGGVPAAESAAARSDAPGGSGSAEAAALAGTDPAPDGAPAGGVPAQGGAPAAESAAPRPLSKKARRAQRNLARAARAAQTAAAQTGPAQTSPAQTGPAQAPAPGPEQVERRYPRRPAVRLPAEQIALQRWDIDAVDAAGHLLLSWRGVELRDAGPLPRHSAWPPALLGVYLERASRDACLDHSLRVAVRSGQPDVAGGRLLAAPAPPAPGALEAPPGQYFAADPRSVAGYELAVSAAVPVACAWSLIDAGHRQEQPPAAIAAVYARLREQLDESPVLLAARLRVISACVTVNTRPGATGPEAEEDQWSAVTAGGGWIALQAGAVSVACALTEVSGVPGRVAVAIASSRIVAGPVAESPRTPAGAVGQN